MKPLAAILLILALLPTAAQAEAEESGARALQPAERDPTWAKECSACHIAYAPGLLPAESWRLLMAGLDKHFGTDASLTAPEKQAVTAFLVNHASTRGALPGASWRITETPWFKRQHGAGEVPPGTWKRASVKSPANCQACHAGADQGDFDERSVRIPQ